jgi:hypothetical protein
MRPFGYGGTGIRLRAPNAVMSVESESRGIVLCVAVPSSRGDYHGISWVLRRGKTGQVFLSR